MSIEKMYGIYDLKARQYEQPLYLPHHAAAIRMVKDIMDNPKSIIGKYPEDFELHYMGTYDKETGLHANVNVPELIISLANLAATFIAQKHQNQGEKNE